MEDFEDKDDDVAESTFRCCGVLIISLLLIPLVLFPGALVVMFIDIWAQFNSTFWVWYWTVLFSFVIFYLTDCNCVKYLIIDGSLIITMFIMSMVLKDFHPFKWVSDHLHVFESVFR